MQNTPTYESEDTRKIEPLTEWANEPSVMDLQEDLQIAKPGHDTHVQRVKRWLNLRDGKLKNPITEKNRSKVQPKLVRKQAEWRYSALSEPFLSAEKLFNVSPVTWEDTKGAEQNELVLNHQFDTKFSKVKFIDQYVRTTVDEGGSVIRLGWRRETKMVKKTVPAWQYMRADNPEAIQVIQQAIAMMDENPQGFSELPENVQRSAEYSMEKGIPAIAQEAGTMEIEEEKIIRNHPTLDIADFENIYIDPAAEGDISKAGFAIVSFETSKAELLKDGRYKNLDKVNWGSNTPLHQPDHASYNTDQLGHKDDLRKRVVAFEYWGWYDIEKNDTLVPIVATWIGNHMIRMEQNPFPDQELPIVVVPYLPVKGSIHGEPDAELLEENQDILGAVTRGVIDTMGRSANGQRGIARGMLDPVNRRRFDAGRDYEFNQSVHPGHGFHDHKYPELPNSVLTVMQLQNQEAESLTGVKAFSGGLSGEAYGEVAAGIRGLLDAASKREMSILRRLAEGIEEIGRKLISMNSAFLSEEEVVQVTNEEFVTVLREDLVGEFNLKVDINTAEIDEAKAQDLGFMLQTMGNNLDFSLTKLILVEIAKLKRMPKLAKQIENFEPQPDPLEQKRTELEIAKLSAEIAEIEAETQERIANAQLRVAKAREASSSADNKDLDFVEQETGTKHARDMDKQQAQAEGNIKLELTKSMLSSDPQEGTDGKITDAVVLNNALG